MLRDCLDFIVSGWLESPVKLKMPQISRDFEPIFGHFEILFLKFWFTKSFQKQILKFQFYFKLLVQDIFVLAIFKLPDIIFIEPKNMTFLRVFNEEKCCLT